MLLKRGQGHGTNEFDAEELQSDPRNNRILINMAVMDSLLRAGEQGSPISDKHLVVTDVIGTDGDPRSKVSDNLKGLALTRVNHRSLEEISLKDLLPALLGAEPEGDQSEGSGTMTYSGSDCSSSKSAPGSLLYSSPSSAVSSCSRHTPGSCQSNVTSGSSLASCHDVCGSGAVSTLVFAEVQKTVSANEPNSLGKCERLDLQPSSPPSEYSFSNSSMRAHGNPPQRVEAKGQDLHGDQMIPRHAMQSNTETSMRPEITIEYRVASAYGRKPASTTCDTTEQGFERADLGGKDGDLCSSISKMRLARQERHTDLQRRAASLKRTLRLGEYSSPAHTSALDAGTSASTSSSTCSSSSSRPSSPCCFDFAAGAPVLTPLSNLVCAESSNEDKAGVQERVLDDEKEVAQAGIKFLKATAQVSPDLEIGFEQVLPYLLGCGFSQAQCQEILSEMSHPDKSDAEGEGIAAASGEAGQMQSEAGGGRSDDEEGREHAKDAKDGGEEEDEEDEGEEGVGDEEVVKLQIKELSRKMALIQATIMREEVLKKRERALEEKEKRVIAQEEALMAAISALSKSHVPEEMARVVPSESADVAAQRVGFSPGKDKDCASLQAELAPRVHAGNGNAQMIRRRLVSRHDFVLSKIRLGVTASRRLKGGDSPSSSRSHTYASLMPVHANPCSSTVSAGRGMSSPLAPPQHLMHDIDEQQGAASGWREEGAGSQGNHLPGSGFTNQPPAPATHGSGCSSVGICWLGVVALLVLIALPAKMHSACGMEARFARWITAARQTGPALAGESRWRDWKRDDVVHGADAFRHAVTVTISTDRERHDSYPAYAVAHHNSGDPGRAGYHVEDYIYVRGSLTFNQPSAARFSSLTSDTSLTDEMAPIATNARQMGPGKEQEKEEKEEEEKEEEDCHSNILKNEAGSHLKSAGEEDDVQKLKSGDAVQRLPPASSELFVGSDWHSSLGDGRAQQEEWRWEGGEAQLCAPSRVRDRSELSVDTPREIVSKKEWHSLVEHVWTDRKGAAATGSHSAYQSVKSVDTVVVELQGELAGLGGELKGQCRELKASRARADVFEEKLEGLNRSHVEAGDQMRELTSQVKELLARFEQLKEAGVCGNEPRKHLGRELKRRQARNTRNKKCSAIAEQDSTALLLARDGAADSAIGGAFEYGNSSMPDTGCNMTVSSGRPFQTRPFTISLKTSKAAAKLAAEGLLANATGGPWCQHLATSRNMQVHAHEEQRKLRPKCARQMALSSVWADEAVLTASMAAAEKLHLSRPERQRRIASPPPPLLLLLLLLLLKSRLRQAAAVHGFGATVKLASYHRQWTSNEVEAIKFRSNGGVDAAASALSSGWHPLAYSSGGDGSRIPRAASVEQSRSLDEKLFEEKPRLLHREITGGFGIHGFCVAGAPLMLAAGDLGKARTETVTALRRFIGVNGLVEDGREGGHGAKGGQRGHEVDGNKGDARTGGVKEAVGVSRGSQSISSYVKLVLLKVSRPQPPTLNPA